MKRKLMQRRQRTREGKRRKTKRKERKERKEGTRIQTVEITLMIVATLLAKRCKPK